MYDTAARVQELADLAVGDIRLDDPAMVALTGKGSKTRHVPLADNTTALLAAYRAEQHFEGPGHDRQPLFFNQHRFKLSRGGMTWILRKYQTRTGNPELTQAPIRTVRTLPVTSYEVGVPLPYIRDILGHVDLSATEVYARASTEAKRKALEAADSDIVTTDLPEWNQNPELLTWLASL